MEKITQNVSSCVIREMMGCRRHQASPFESFGGTLKLLCDSNRECGTLPVALASLLDSLHRIPTLNLAQNPWEHPPEPIVAGGMSAVRAYFEAIYRGGTTAVTRPLKVVIIGKETVGKTSLLRSITTGEPCKTADGGAESTVHVDVEDHEVDGHPIRIFDCAGQVVYYGLLQLFLTPRAVYLLVCDAGEASKMEWNSGNDSKNARNLESLAIARWLRHLTFRVPDANVVLVANKWDLVTSNHSVASEVERQSREWLTSWIENARGHQHHEFFLGSRRQSRELCAACPSTIFRWEEKGNGWPCDKSTPGLFHRITHNPAGDPRALRMCLPDSYQVALQMLEQLASRSRREVEYRSPGITRANLEVMWKAKVVELEGAGKPVAAPEAAMSGAILIRKWEGGLVEYGSYIFLDVQWFATVLDPLFSHKRESFGKIYFGGKRLTQAVSSSLDRLEEHNVFEPQLAQELWGAELAPHLLLALKSAGLTFPLPRDEKGGLVILLRMKAEPPKQYSMKLNGQLQRAGQAGKHDLRLHLECSFSLGLPPGFIERLLARCCRLGYPFPFWRYGALIVGEGAQEGRFSISLNYSEEDKILTVEVYGGSKEVHAWGALSKVLSVTMKMFSEFPGLPRKATFFCPVDKTNGMPIRTTDEKPGSSLVEECYFCPVCHDRAAGKELLAVALQVVEFSDEEFDDAQLRKQFAENAERVARGGGALWPGSNFEVSGPAPAESSESGQAPRAVNRSRQVSGPTPVQISPGGQSPPPINPSSEGSRTPWYQELKIWLGAASAACFTIYGVLAAKEDDDPRVWGVFLGVGVLLLLLDLLLIAKNITRWCVEASSARNDHGSRV